MQNMFDKCYFLFHTESCNGVHFSSDSHPSQWPCTLYWVILWRCKIVTKYGKSIWNGDLFTGICGTFSSFPKLYPLTKVAWIWRPMYSYCSQRNFFLFSSSSSSFFFCFSFCGLMIFFCIILVFSSFLVFVKLLYIFDLWLPCFWIMLTPSYIYLL